MYFLLSLPASWLTQRCLCTCLTLLKLNPAHKDVKRKVAQMQGGAPGQQEQGAAILFGASPGQGNLATVRRSAISRHSGFHGPRVAAQVRARAKELRDSLAEVHAALGQKAHLLQWEDVLQKFSVLNMQVCPNCSSNLRLPCISFHPPTTVSLHPTVAAAAAPASSCFSNGLCAAPRASCICHPAMAALTLPPAGTSMSTEMVMPFPCRAW